MGAQFGQVQRTRGHARDALEQDFAGNVAALVTLEVDGLEPARQVRHVDAGLGQVTDERLVVQLHQHVADVEHHVANHRPTTPAGAPSLQAR